MTDSHKNISLRDIVVKLYTSGSAILEMLFFKFPLYASRMETSSIKCCMLFQLNLFTFRAVETRVYFEIICNWVLQEPEVKIFLSQ